MALSVHFGSGCSLCLLCQALWHKTSEVSELQSHTFRFVSCLLDSWSELNVFKMFSNTTANHSRGIWGINVIKAAVGSHTSGKRPGLGFSPLKPLFFFPFMVLPTNFLAQVREKTSQRTQGHGWNPTNARIAGVHTYMHSLRIVERAYTDICTF